MTQTLLYKNYYNFIVYSVSNRPKEKIFCIHKEFTFLFSFIVFVVAKNILKNTTLKFFNYQLKQHIGFSQFKKYIYSFVD